MRLYVDYLSAEYGALDCDYVFVNLWGNPHGRPLSYPAVYDLVGRLRRRTGIEFGPHHFRHTYATMASQPGRRHALLRKSSAAPTRCRSACRVARRTTSSGGPSNA